MTIAAQLIASIVYAHVSPSAADHEPAERRTDDHRERVQTVRERERAA